MHNLIGESGELWDVGNRKTALWFAHASTVTDRNSWYCVFSVIAHISSSNHSVYAYIPVPMNENRKSSFPKYSRAPVFAHVLKVLFQTHSGKYAIFYRWALAHRHTQFILDEKSFSSLRIAILQNITRGESWDTFCGELWDTRYQCFAIR